MEMQKATAKAKYIIAVLSPDYLNARSAESKWTTVFRRDISGKQGRLLPVYVHECGEELRKPLGSIVYIDLVGKDEPAAREILLASISFARSKPSAAPAFPGRKISRSLVEQPSFPAPPPAIDPGTILMQQMNMMSKIVDALSKRDSSPIDPDISRTQQMLSLIQAAFIKKDWPDVIRKADHLVKQAPSTISSEVYRMLWQALLEEGETLRAHEALDTALALVTDSSQRLSLLQNCTSVLSIRGQWKEVQRYVNEALRLAPNDSYWLTLQREALIHLNTTTHDQRTDDTSTMLKVEDSIVTIQAPTKIIKQEDQSDQLTFIALPQQRPTRSIEIFFAYARKDEELRDELAKQLSMLKWQKLIKDWHDREISAGNEWAQEIDKHLNTAHIILLLVSADFIASEYCYGTEVQRALQRHEAREARVIPVILRPVDWKSTPLSKLQALPRDGIPVTSWINRDEAFYSVAQGIRKIVEHLTANT
jgi:tetratricopeptide (TPR) repeat protein